MKLPRVVLAAVLASTMFTASPALAGGDQMDQVLDRLDKLSATVAAQQKLLQSQAAEIHRLKAELDRQGQAGRQTRAKVEHVASEKSKIPTVKEVLGDRFSFSTDLRLRYEGLYDRTQGDSNLDDRHRWRIRWRVFGSYQVTDELSLHSMLTTSSGSWFDDGKNSHNWQPGRTSNQTMDDEFNNKDVFVGRIYATYLPKWAPGLEIAAGKFKNTFLNTDIMWDPDVNPEGAYQRFQYDGWGVVKPFVHLGQMVVAENNKTDDAFLFIYQAGAEINLPAGVKWTVAGSYYDWTGLDTSNLSRVEGSSAGNSVGEDGLYLYDYKLLQAITFLDFKLAGMPVQLFFDYIHNLGEDVPGDNDTAWATGFMLGKAKKQGDWALYLKYAEIEPDALVGAVTDGDFFGTNRQGYKVQVRYQLFDPWQARLSWFQTDTMVGEENSESRLQLDMIFYFKL